MANRRKENTAFKAYLKFFVGKIIPEVNKCGGLERLYKDAGIDLDRYSFENIYYELLGSCPGSFVVGQGELTFGFNRLTNIAEFFLSLWIEKSYLGN